MFDLADAGTDVSAHTSESLCLDCDAGTFAEAVGSGTCEICGVLSVLVART